MAQFRIKEIAPKSRIFMKKILSVAFTLMLAGCTGGATTTQILTQSVEEEVMPVTQTMPATPAPDMNKPKPAMTKPAPKPVMAQKPAMEKPVATAANKPAKKPAVAKSKSQHENRKYTIQVIALSHNKGFAEYMNKLPSDKPVWSNKKMVDGLPWFTLLYGEFNSKVDAENALKALPKNIKQYGPFIRSFASIKASSTPEMTRLN